MDGAAGGFEAGDAAGGASAMRRGVGQHAGDVGRRVEDDAELGGELDERFGNGARAAHRVPDTLLHLHVADGAEDGGRGVRGGADVLNEVVEHLRGVAVGNELADGAGDGFAQAHLHDVFEDVEVEGAADVHGVAHGADGAPEEEAVGDGVELFRGFEELEIPGAHRRPDGVERRGHLARIVFEVHHFTVVEEASPLWIQADHLYVIVKVTICFLEDFAEDGGLDEDGRAHVEAEAIL